MDIVFLHDLKIKTVIGVYAWERDIQQTVIIDLDMASDIRQAAIADSIDAALDYKAVAKRIINFVEISTFQLVETLAEKIAAILLKEFDITWVRVKVNKHGAITGAGAVGVVIERHRASLQD
ncbi:dihydroneopterin aldolase [Achromatium sp. WMS2]|nr:dihydroneopterin aldolase [Achromatium sp. WMS2]